MRNKAWNLAQKMRKFRAQTEQTQYSETNPNVDQLRVEVVRQIDWAAFDKIIGHLEFCQLAARKGKAGN